MEGLYSKYIFLILWLTIAFVGVKKEASIEKRGYLKLFNRIAVLVAMLCAVLACCDLSQYWCYNNTKFTLVSSVEINGRQLTKKQQKQLFSEIKQDEFTWVNHPIVTRADTVKVLTQDDIFIFTIKHTTNEGVLVSRAVNEHSDYVTNRNDQLGMLIEKIVSH